MVKMRALFLELAFWLHLISISSEVVVAAALWETGLGEALEGRRFYMTHTHPTIFSELDHIHCLFCSERLGRKWIRTESSSHSVENGQFC
jgi:hypothetical protein